MLFRRNPVQATAITGLFAANGQSILSRVNRAAIRRGFGCPLSQPLLATTVVSAFDPLRTSMATAYEASMRYLRWIASVCFVAGFIATFTRSYTEHRYLWLAVWAFGMVCLIVGMRRKPA